MRIFKTVVGLRTYLKKKPVEQSLSLVPTMGALHPGHISLICRAVAETDIVVVSIFINPLQFGSHDDLELYPRQWDRDCQLCRKLGVKVLFAPTYQEMGMKNNLQEHITTVIPPLSMSSSLCGAFRPGHFSGVTTIVTKLLIMVTPDVAFFGEKDAQQLAIIKKLVRDLNLPVTIKGCPIVREPSGLAYSSRNQYLSQEERKQALILFKGLKKGQEAFDDGEHTAKRLLYIVRKELGSNSGVNIQYVSLVDPDTLVALDRIKDAGLLAVAAHVGSTRLIDNIILRMRQPIIAIDGPAGAGKSTVTRQVAKALNLLYLDTGAMYRAIAWLVKHSEVSLDAPEAIAELVSQSTLEFISTTDGTLPRIKINGEDITDAIRTPEVTALVSHVSAQRVVRDKLVRYQQQFGKKGGLVAEGRDIGTNLFPDADLKIFLTASVAERARRRWQEFQAQGHNRTTLEELEQEIKKRDYQDSHRSLAPLRQAVDAIVINTEGLTIEEVTNKIIHFYHYHIVSY
ncbi:bifunctional pantoate--beta-alanine ligase/(d)CMP kinase [Cyanobacterium sp. uoEpiScrs1]|uniref:bifunctional pantoate--beta-alanine ligase/(d)CMP kinase n=1 Tax=Cyanobacterium sp. uoEpiScrs1 TaxID=2976343 RepID=UPI00226AAA8C|nr:bifunctional pantoate--beta-alanine ligase/(d)CMP kinase [Cyanobacterium sp. uoEpiScrs1]